MSYGIGFPREGLPNQGWQLYIASLTMVLVAGPFVITRCVERIRSRQLGWDDYTIILSIAISIFLSVCIQTAVTYGYGVHKAQLAKHDLHEALFWFYVAQTPYKIVVGLNKTSVVLLYKRIFIGRAFQITAWIVLAIVASWTVASVMATIFQCVPIAASWDKSVEAKCIDSNAFWLYFAISNVLTDVLVLVVPLPEIFKLHLNMRKRIGLCGVFLLGGFVVVCGIMRTASVSNSLENKSDITYNFIPRGIWTLVEANMGIICACLPLLHKTCSGCIKRSVELTYEMTNRSRSRPDNVIETSGSGFSTGGQKSMSSRLSRRDEVKEWQGKGGFRLPDSETEEEIVMIHDTADIGKRASSPA